MCIDPTWSSVFIPMNGCQCSEYSIKHEYIEWPWRSVVLNCIIDSHQSCPVLVHPRYRFSLNHQSVFGLPFCKPDVSTYASDYVLHVLQSHWPPMCIPLCWRIHYESQFDSLKHARRGAQSDEDRKGPRDTATHILKTMKMRRAPKPPKAMLSWWPTFQPRKYMV